MSIYTPENAWPEPFYFQIGQHELMIGLFRMEPFYGYQPALCRKNPTTGEWIAKVERQAVLTSEFNQHYASPEQWADRDIEVYNEWLREEYGEDSELTDFEEWVRDMTARYNAHTLVMNQLVLLSEVL